MCPRGQSLQQLVSDKLSCSRQANGDLSSSPPRDVCFGLSLHTGSGGPNPPVVEISTVPLEPEGLTSPGGHFPLPAAARVFRCERQQSRLSATVPGNAASAISMLRRKQSENLDGPVLLLRSNCQYHLTRGKGRMFHKINGQYETS